MIKLRLDDRATEFETDIRELCKAFYPGESFSIHTSSGVHLAESSPNEEVILDLEVDTSNLNLRGDRKSDKSIVKKYLYQKLGYVTGKSLPWGDLTGIRPVSLASAKLEALSDRSYDREIELSDIENIRASLEDEYMIKGEKLDLLMDIALREQNVLNIIHDRTGRSYREGFSLYIGIPFCPNRCLYCSFTSNPISLWNSRLQEYFDCLRREIRYTMDKMCVEKGLYLQSIYIGGGTPTALDENWLSYLMELLREECFSHEFSNVCEFTVEAGRPDSINRDKLLILRENGVGRISVNPQTFHQKTLDLIGRKHTVAEVIDAFYMAREVGFDNINMDIILGLPGERLKEVEETLREIENLKPDSLTVHSLSVKRAARLTLERDYWSNVYRAGGDSTFKDGKTEMERMMELSARTAETLNLKPYYLYRQKNMSGNLENVGYASGGKECLYNILMMEEKHTVVGCGAGTSTKVVYGDGRIERADTGKDIRNYIENIQEMIARKERVIL